MPNINNYESVTLPHGMGQRELFPDGKLEIFKHKQYLKSLARVYFEEKFHGPPKFAHGGAQAYVLDEVMGCTCWMHGIYVVAKKIEVEFIRPTPLKTQLFATGLIVSQKESIAYVNATICDDNDEVYSKSSGEFRILTGEKLEKFRSKWPTP